MTVFYVSKHREKTRLKTYLQLNFCVLEECIFWLKTQHSKNKDHGVQSHRFMANRWGTNGKQWLTLFSWAPKSLQMVTAAMKLKRRLLLERKARTILDSVLKSRDITLLTKVPLVKTMVFPAVMYGCESWTIKLSTEESMLLNCGVGEDS